MKTLATLFAMILVWQAFATMPADARSSKLLIEKLQDKFLHGVNGGVNCVICTALVGLGEQLAIVYNETVDKSLERFCSYLPDGIFRLACKEAVLEFGPIIITGLYAKETPDVVCRVLKFCTVDKGQPECNLFPKPKSSITRHAEKLTTLLKQKGIKVPETNDPAICNRPELERICQYLHKIFDKHDPAVDSDHDGFSTYQTLRGSSWRGRDCNDLNVKTRPGIKVTSGDYLEDTNCNGIFGRDPNTGESYEDKFCKDTKQFGMALLGDSIGAHFHLPEQWIDAYQISETAFQHLAFILENEVDWPHLSYSTGHVNNSWPVITGPTRSLYLHLFEHNHCNMRDYQNLGVNGADTSSILSIMKSLNRTQLEDQPLLLAYSSVGNDVCNGNSDTLNHMTPPDVFYKNVVEAMTYLDTILPSGSHVFLTGLANGSVLYELVGERIYPIGRVKNDVKYKDLYTYLTCMEISPCNGWMTTNATLRQLTNDYAVMLSGIVKNVTETHKFKNFDMLYVEFPADRIFKKWESMGGEDWQIIEPVDGFHMNQFAHYLLADELWSIFAEQRPDWFGPANPHNADIEELFGDQGGY